MSSVSVCLFLLLVFAAVWVNAQRTSCDRYNCEGCSNSDLDDIRQSLKKIQHSLEQQNYFPNGSNRVNFNSYIRISLEKTNELLERLANQNNLATGRLNRCPTGFNHSATAVNKCYAIDLHATNWTEAQAKCKALNAKAHLAVINSPLENQIINELLTDYDCDGFIGRNWFWTSGGRQNHDCSSPLVWKSHTSNNQPVTYTNFCPSEPSCNILNVQSCMTFAKSCYSNENVNGWQDDVCQYAYCSICEVMML